MGDVLMFVMAVFIAVNPLLAGACLFIAWERRRWQAAALGVVLITLYLFNQGPQISCLIWSVATSDLRHWKT